MRRSTADAPARPRRLPIRVARWRLPRLDFWSGQSIVAAAWAVLRHEGPDPAGAVRFTYTPPASQAARAAGKRSRHGLRDRWLVCRVSRRHPRVAIAFDGARNQRHRSARAARHGRTRGYPFVSPDSKWVGFFVGAQLRKVPVAGGAPVMIGHAGGAPRGGSWGDDDSIVLATADSNGLLRVAGRWRRSQGADVPSDLAKRETIGNPHVLPGSRTVLFTAFVDQEFCQRPYRCDRRCDRRTQDHHQWWH